MKALLLTLTATLLASAPAFADHAYYTCTAKPEANGLGIRKLEIDVDDIEPEAVMTIVYERGTHPVKTDMVVANYDDEYKVTPDTEKDGNVIFHIIKKGADKGTYAEKLGTKDRSALDCQLK